MVKEEIKKVMIMIPTYNESDNITQLIGEIHKHLPQAEIVVVDDDSPDKTWQIVDEMSKDDKKLHLIRRTKNKGRGFAGIDGFKYCLKKGADIIVEMDADFSHHPRYLPRLINALEECDVVLGSRFVRSRKEHSNRPLYRKLITRLANFYIRLFLGVPVRDCNSGYRVFRREVLEAIDLDSFMSKGPSIVQEVLYKVYLKGFRIKEVPVYFTDRIRGSSSLTFSKVLAGYFMVLKLRLMHALGRF